MINKLIRSIAKKILSILAIKGGREVWIKSIINRDFNYQLLRKPGQRMINIGAGSQFCDKNFVALDFNPIFTKYTATEFPFGKKVHFDLMDRSTRMPFNNLDIVYSSHSFEHLPVCDVLRILLQVHANMKDGAILRIVVPDADLILDALKRNDLDFFAFYRPYFGGIVPSIIDYVFLFLHTGAGRVIHGTLNKNFREETYAEFEKLKNENNINIINWFNSIKTESDAKGTFHQSAHNFNSLSELLRQSGFRNIYRSAFMQSRETILREVPKFDGTHPWMSLYIEAFK